MYNIYKKVLKSQTKEELNKILETSTNEQLQGLVKLLLEDRNRIILEANLIINNPTKS